MNASSINPFFHKIDLSTTTGINTFNNAIVGLDDEENYDGIQYSITKHIQAGKDQGEKYGWSNNVAMIDTTPGVHISVYDYHGLITKQVIETASQAIWKIANDANIQHSFSLICCTYFIAHLLHTNHGTRSKRISILGKNKAAEMYRHLFGTCTMLQKEQRVQYSTSSGKWIFFAPRMRVTISWR